MATYLTGFALTAAILTTPDNPSPPDLVLAPVQDQVFGAPPFPVFASSNSAGDLTYSIVSGPASITGNIVTVTDLGLVTIQASQVAFGSFLAGTVTGNFSVLPASPGLHFLAIANVTYPATPFTITAVSASTGTIEYYLVSGPATVAGNTVTVTGVGTILVGAAQPATANYIVQATTSSLVVSPGTPTLAFDPIPQNDVLVGSVFPVNATSVSDGAITYSIVTGPAVMAGNLATVTGNSGSIVIQADQAATTNWKAATTTIMVSFGFAGFGQAFGLFGSGL